MENAIAETPTAEISQEAADSAANTVNKLKPSPDGKHTPTSHKQVGKHVPLASGRTLLSTFAKEIEAGDEAFANTRFQAAITVLVTTDLIAHGNQLELGRLHAWYTDLSIRRQEVFCARRLDDAVKVWEAHNKAHGFKGKKRVVFNPSDFKTDSKGRPISGRPGFLIALYAPLTLDPRFADVLSVSGLRKDSKASDRVRYADKVLKDHLARQAALEAERQGQETPADNLPGVSNEPTVENPDGAELEPAQAPADKVKANRLPQSAPQMYKALYQIAGGRNRMLANKKRLLYRVVLHELGLNLGYSEEQLSKWESDAS